MKNRALLLGPLLFHLFACNLLFGIRGRDSDGDPLVSSRGNSEDAGLGTASAGSDSMSPVNSSAGNSATASVSVSTTTSASVDGGPKDTGAVQAPYASALDSRGALSLATQDVPVPVASSAELFEETPDAGDANHELPVGSLSSTLIDSCGNGVQESGEQCDDSNRNDWDGCAANCQTESEWVLKVNGKLTPAFDPKTVEYVVNLSLFVQNLELTAKAPHAGTFRVAESLLGPDGTWVSSPLAAGETSVELKVMDGAEERKSIRLRVRRSDPTETEVRASDALRRGYFGSSVSLSSDGKLLAVGATGGIDTPGNLEGAVYLFVLDADGFWVEKAVLKATNAGSRDAFGYRVALSADGKTLAIGAPSEDGSVGGVSTLPTTDEAAEDSGAVYIFELDTLGSWHQHAYLKAASPGKDDNFGVALALSADGATLAIGAPRDAGSTSGVSDGIYTDDLSPASGAVYVFARGVGGWTQQAYVKASNPDAEDMFGRSVALSADGNALAVGAPGEASDSRGVNAISSSNNDASAAGAVYLLARSVSKTWTYQTYVKASNPDASDEFGGAVALSADGKTLAVGAYGEDSSGGGVSSGSITNNDAENSGAAYVFESRGNGTWDQSTYLKASNAAESQAFGTELALSADGNALLVGANGEKGSKWGISDGKFTDDLTDASGAAYLFHRTPVTWSQRAYIKSLAPGKYDLFGGRLAISADGQSLAIASELDDGSLDTVYDSGSVFVVR